MSQAGRFRAGHGRHPGRPDRRGHRYPAPPPLRHSLIINRTLGYGTLTATLVAVYFGAVVVLQGIGSVVLQVPFRALTGQETQLATVAATLAIVARFNP